MLNTQQCKPGCVCSLDVQFTNWSLALPTELNRIELCVCMQVSWLRDGRQIDPQADTNFVVANDGSLILSRAREFDSGSYVCVAQNVAGTRKTQPAKLVVVGKCTSSSLLY